MIAEKSFNLLTLQKENELNTPERLTVTGNLLIKKMLTTAAEEAVLNRLLVGGRGPDMATLDWLRRKRLKAG